MRLQHDPSDPPPLATGSRSVDGRAHDEVDLWSTGLRPIKDRSVALAILDPEERARAERFRFRLDAERYVARHIYLRQVLGSYLHVPPQAVRISRTQLGKPRLDAASGIDFSASHSRGRAIIAVSRGARVGVDIERVRHIDDALDLATCHMTEQEVARLRAGHDASRSQAFLEVWTRKEATVKAVGMGLHLPLDSFDTGEPGPDGLMHPVGLPGDPAMSVVQVGGLSGYVAAVALEGERLTVHRRTELERAA